MKLFPHSLRTATVLVAATLLAACAADNGDAPAVTAAPIAPAPSSAAAATTTSGATTSAESATTTGATTTAAPESAGAADGKTAIVVDSTADQYFVLYVKPDLAAATEYAIAIARGQAGTTTLTDGRAQLTEAHYRVETFEVASPGDVDGDGIDDLTELADPVAMNPLNAAPKLDIDTGAVVVPDATTYQALSYQGDDVARDAYLAGVEFMKFWILDIRTSNPSVYFMNTGTYNAHPVFAEAVGIQGGRGPSPDRMRGDIVYEPDAIAPDGTKGRYRFAFQPNDAYSFEQIAMAYEVLSASMPFLDGNLMYYPFPQSALPLYKKQQALYDAYRVPVVVD